MSAIETASPRASSWSASETAPRISEDWLSLPHADIACELGAKASVPTKLGTWRVAERVSAARSHARPARPAAA
jgi:hypothetical protein